MSEVTVNFSSKKEEIRSLVKELRKTIHDFRQNEISYLEAIHRIDEFKKVFADDVVTMTIFHVCFLESIMGEGINFDYDDNLF